VLFGLVPLQFSDLPIQIQNSEMYHYNSLFPSAMPFSMSSSCLGLLSGVCVLYVFLYGPFRPCPIVKGACACGPSSHSLLPLAHSVSLSSPTAQIGRDVEIVTLQKHANRQRLEKMVRELHQGTRLTKCTVLSTKLHHLFFDFTICNVTFTM